MGLESSFDFITDLNPLNPVVGDNVSQGDDHLRGIKNALAGTFTGFSGVALAATEAQIDALTIPVYHSSINASDVVTNTGFETPATWTDENTSGMTSFTTATGVLIVATTGKYLVTCGFFDVDFDLTATWSFGLSLDGSDPTGRWLASRAQAGANDSYGALSLSGIVSITAADTLEVQSKVSAQSATFLGLYLTVLRVA